MQNKSVLFGISIFIIVIIIVTGCSTHKALNSEDFKKQFGALGYTIESDNNHLYAVKSDIPFEYDYYEYDDEIVAIKEYDKFKKLLFEYNLDEALNEEESGNDYSKNVISSDNNYIVISRVKNTIIVVSGDINYKNEINRVLKDINY